MKVPLATVPSPAITFARRRAEVQVPSDIRLGWSPEDKASGV